MRVPKYKAWIKSEGHEGYMTEVTGINFPTGFILIPMSDDPRESRRVDFEECTLRAFTGYHDKDGREIYEGDILTDCHKRLLQVVWRNGALQFEALKETNFLYADIYQWFDGLTENPEVIGNIYENGAAFKMTVEVCRK